MFTFCFLIIRDGDVIFVRRHTVNIVCSNAETSISEQLPGLSTVLTHTLELLIGTGYVGLTRTVKKVPLYSRDAPKISRNFEANVAFFQGKASVYIPFDVIRHHRECLQFLDLLTMLCSECTWIALLSNKVISVDGGGINRWTGKAFFIRRQLLQASLRRSLRNSMGGFTIRFSPYSAALSRIDGSFSESYDIL